MIIHHIQQYLNHKTGLIPICAKREVNENTTFQDIPLAQLQNVYDTFKKHTIAEMYRGFYIHFGYRKQFLITSEALYATAYAFETKEKTLFPIAMIPSWIDEGKDAENVKKLIDRILQEDRFFHGMSYKGSEYDQHNYLFDTRKPFSFSE